MIISQVSFYVGQPVADFDFFQTTKEWWPRARQTNESKMSMKLYAHPFASYCQKVLIALYENDTPFEFRMLAPGSTCG